MLTLIMIVSLLCFVIAVIGMIICCFKIIKNLINIVPIPVCILHDTKIIKFNKNFAHTFTLKDAKCTLIELFEPKGPAKFEDKIGRIYNITSFKFLHYRIVCFALAEDTEQEWLYNMPLPTLVINGKGFVCKFNMLAGAYIEDAIGCNIADFIAKTRHKDWFNLLSKAKDNSDNWHNIEFFWKGAVKLFIKQINQERLLVIIDDLNEMETLRQQAQKAQNLQTMGALVTGIVHDFNNMLTAIFGFTHLIEQKPGMQNNNDIKHINTIIKRAQEIVKQLLTLSTEDKEQGCDLIKVIEDSLPILQISCENIELYLKKTTSKDCMVNMSKGQLLQIATNLTLNAKQAKATKIQLTLDHKTVQGVISIKSGSLMNGEYAMLTVEDNGTGISDQIAHKLLKTFLTTKKDGAGVGLASITRMINMQGGGLDFHSNYNGTTFIVYLPIMKQAGKGNNNANAKLLLVEDDSMIRELTAKALRYKGYEVVEAENGEQALEKFDRSIQCIITDALMPKMNGVQLIHKLQEMRINVPIFLISGIDASELCEHVPKNVITLTKPIQIKDLLMVLGKYLT